MKCNLDLLRFMSSNILDAFLEKLHEMKLTFYRNGIISAAWKELIERNESILALYIFSIT